MNQDKMCNVTYENGQANVYEQINKQTMDTAEYDSLKITKTKKENGHIWTSCLTSPKVIVCALVVNAVVIVSLFTVGVAVIMELSGKVSKLTKRLDTDRTTTLCTPVQQNGTFTKSGYKVAFTATNANESVPIIFVNSIYNVGGCYDNRTGHFTSPIPGIYHFSFTMTKQYGADIDYLKCSLFVNSKEIVGTMTDPYENNSDNNGYSLSLSGTFQLGADDIVYVGCDTDASVLISRLCSFTGFLVAADN